MQTQNALCVGGPYDGQTFVVDDNRDWFRVMQPAPQSDFLSNDPVGPIEVRYITYTRRTIVGLYVWAPDVLREQQIIQLLIMRYFSGNASKER